MKLPKYVNLSVPSLSYLLTNNGVDIANLFTRFVVVLDVESEIHIVLPDVGGAKLSVKIYGIPLHELTGVGVGVSVATLVGSGVGVLVAGKGVGVGVLIPHDTSIQSVTKVAISKS